MTRYAVALGSNMGDRLAHLRSAIGEMEAVATGTVAVSSLYETAPVGGPDQPPFLNAVVAFEADIEPHALLDLLNEVENASGRVRGDPWGPRTLDLDIVASSAVVDDPPRLVVPHPRAIERRFVLEPLCEVWPGVPVNGGVAARSALSAVRYQDADIVAGPHWPGEERSGLFWMVAQMAWVVGIAAAVVWQGSPPDWTPWRIVGSVIGFFGMAGIVWSGMTSERNPAAADSERVTESGPYRWVRHPLYSSVVLALVGVSLLTDAPLALALSATLLYFFRLKAGYEEGRVRTANPGYREYVKRVRWWLIPGLE